ncbi:MAG: FAD/NAD(P)-binding oxidoreductase [Sulfurovum sp.]
MNRRDTFKLATVAVATTLMPNILVAKEKEEEKKEQKSTKKASGKSVVVVGGGFGGLTLAKSLRGLDSSIEVTLIEKNSIFMAYPLTNSLLGGVENIALDRFVADYYQPARNHGYCFVNATVTDIDRESKVVASTVGNFAYDILVLATGIAYDYKRQFPHWTKKKINQVSQSIPAGLISANEILALKREIDNLKGGDVVIIPPAVDKYKCPPAPYERASMIAYHIKEKKLKSKVIILDTKDGIFSKDKAFFESWKDLYADIIEYRGLTEIKDVDLESKSISYIEFANAKDTIGVEKTQKYEVCSLMPINRCSPVIEMAELDMDDNGYAIMDGYSFKSKTDDSVYVIGDAVTHDIPASAQTAMWSATKASLQILAQLNNKVYDPIAGLPAKSASVCFSTVSGKPEEGIMITHSFDADGNGLLVAKGDIMETDKTTGKYRSTDTAKASRDWFASIMKELFT